MTDVLDEPSSLSLLGSVGSERDVLDAFEDLFAGDGTIYLVSGYFTYNGYRTIRPHVAAFLDRSPDNELVLVVGPTTDQFSGRVASDLWSLDDGGQVSIYKYPRGLHAKLYLRDGPRPHLVLTSANVTEVAFRYNVELGVEVVADRRDDPQIGAYREWTRDLLESATPLRRRDLYPPVQLGNSLINWTNKARLLPVRNVVARMVPILLLLVFVGVLVRVV